VMHDREQLQKIELFPFNWLIQSGVKAIMSAHLYVNALAEAPQLPATLSKQIVTDLLRNQMCFEGLIISDALNMKALTNRYSAKQIAVEALSAGHDLLLYGDHIAPNIDQILRSDLPEAFAALKQAVESKKISEEQIDAHVNKIIQAKRELGLFEKFPSKRQENILEEINSPLARQLKKRLFQEAITVVRNEGMLPLKQEKVAIIEWGTSSHFNSLIEETLITEVVSITDPQLFTKLQDYSCAILTLSKSNEELLLDALLEIKIPLIAVLFGTPYSIAKLPVFSALVVAYENQREAQEAAAEVVLGKLSPKGHLPVSIQPHFQAGMGLSW
jgi:beta-N-acetylhexosaminidase